MELLNELIKVILIGMICFQAELCIRTKNKYTRQISASCGIAWLMWLIESFTPLTHVLNPMLFLLGLACLNVASEISIEKLKDDEKLQKYKRKE